MAENVEPTRHRIAVIGAGEVTAMHFDGFKASPDRIEVVAVVDPSEIRRKWATETYGVPRAFETLADALSHSDFDVAVVCTPSHVRLETVQALAAAGKHVLVEKPMADGLEEARALVAAADEGGVQLAVDQNFRDFYGFELARKLITEGRIGRVRAINHRWLMFRTDEGWRNDQAHHALMVMGVHWFDGFRRLIDGDATRLIARTYSSPAVPAIGETDAMVQIEFGDVTVSYTDSFSSWISQWDTIVLGEQGTIRIGDGKVVVASPGGQEPFENEYSRPGGKPLSAYRALDHLLDAVESGAEAPNSGRDNLKTIALIDAAYRSAQSGDAVEFDGGFPR